jgi:hypothetical protein
MKLAHAGMLRHFHEKKATPSLIHTRHTFDHPQHAS